MSEHYIIFTIPLCFISLNTTSYLPFHFVSSPWTLHHIYHSTVFHLPEHYIIFTIPLCFISLNTTSYLPFHCVSSPWTSYLHQPHMCCNGLHACLECDRSGFELRSGQTKDNKIGVCCFSAKHTALRSKSKDWSAWNQNNVSEWSNMSTCRISFQWARNLAL